MFKLIGSLGALILDILGLSFLIPFAWLTLLGIDEMNQAKVVIFGIGAIVAALCFIAGVLLHIAVSVEVIERKH